MAMIGSKPQSQVTRDGSKLGRFGRCVCPKGFFGQCVELAGIYVCLKLTIPGLCVKLGEPATKLGKFLTR
jgi:hypothetical protein